ncbi:MAG: glycosyltransferase family 4 protein [Methanobacterium sp.]
MKIAVFHNLPSGGAKRALYGYLDYLDKEGHEVDVFVPSTANEEFLPLKNVSHNLEIFPVKKTRKGSLYSSLKYVPPIIKSISLWDLEKTQKEIAQAINTADYDLVFSEQDQFTMTPFILKYLQKPTIYYCPQPPRNEAILEAISQRKRKINPLKRLVFNYADNKDLKLDKDNITHAKYILTNSYFTRESILRLYGLNSYVSYLGIDTDLFKPQEVDEENFVLSVGSCRPSKGYDFLTRSLALIDSEIRPKLVIVSNLSEPGWEEYLQNLASDLKVDLDILSLIDDEELVSLYNKAKLVLYAPYLEPFGLVPLEAMGCGTPVVAVKEGGVRETVIHQKTGLHTERDELLFAEATLELLADDEKRNQMSINGIKSVKRYWTLKHAGDRLSWHLNRLVD